MRWRPLALVIAVLTPLLVGCQRLTPGPDVSRPILYPPPPSPARIQYLTSLNSSRDIAVRRVGFVRLVLGEETKSQRSDFLKRPFGIAVWDGRIYVCDHSDHDVKVFDVKRHKFYLLSGQSQIIGAPTNICIDSDGYKFVVESMAKKIHVYGPDDQYVTTFLTEGARPADVVSIGNELYVSDAVNNRILVLDRSTGKLVRTLGKLGHGPGEFTLPNAMARDAEGYLYVADQMNYRFQKLDTKGKSLIVAGGAGDSYGHFARPRGIGVGPDGIIYVVESVFEVVQMFNQQGKVLMAFGNYHGAPGFLELPAGIAVDTSCLPYFRKYVNPAFEPEYLIFVVSQVGEAKVGVYAFGHMKPGAERPALPPLKEPKPPSARKPEVEQPPPTPPPAQ